MIMRFIEPFPFIADVISKILSELVIKLLLLSNVIVLLTQFINDDDDDNRSLQHIPKVPIFIGHG